MIKPVKDFEEYSEITKRARKGKKRFTNNVYYPDEIKRFIELERLYYSEDEAGLTLYIDEETYYRIMYQIDPKKKWTPEKLDKPRMVQTRFKKEKKTDELLSFEKQMIENGFEYKDTSVQLFLDVTNLVDKYEREYKRTIKVLEGYNCRIIRPDYSYYNQIDTLMKQQKKIKYYHRQYWTPEEIKKRFEDKCYVAIVNEDDKVLAYNSVFEVRGRLYGEAIVVAEEYKLYGFAPIIFYYCMSGTTNYYRRGDVSLSNKESVALHKKLQWEFTDKYMEHWLDEKVKK